MGWTRCPCCGYTRIVDATFTNSRSEKCKTCTTACVNGPSDSSHQIIANANAGGRAGERRYVAEDSIRHVLQAFPEMLPAAPIPFFHMPRDKEEFKKALSFGCAVLIIVLMMLKFSVWLIRL